MTPLMFIADEFSEEAKVEDKKETKKSAKTAKPGKDKDVAKQKTSKTKDKGEKPKVGASYLESVTEFVTYRYPKAEEQILVS